MTPRELPHWSFPAAAFPLLQNQSSDDHATAHPSLRAELGRKCAATPAALHLPEALRCYADELRIGKGISFAVRMGRNSGEVVVGKIGDDLRMDYTALGHSANLAARMEQSAEPGRIYVAEATAHLCQGFFVLRDLGRHRVRGLSQPVGVFELEGVGRMRTRLELSQRRRPVRSPQSLARASPPERPSRSAVRRT